MILKKYLGGDRALSTWIVAFIIALHTVTGDSAAGAITDTVQTPVVLVGGFAAMVIGFNRNNGWKGIVFAGSIAAVLFSMDATIGSRAALFTTNIYQKFIVKSAADKQCLLVGGLTTSGLVPIGIRFAPVTDHFSGICRAMGS
ncbi:MAG: hypothetical protein JXA18_10610 [Chitinispirillaceae bacterium]|nr:hypothetical protein [Chitinispirillaceae bacterium]